MNTPNSELSSMEIRYFDESLIKEISSYNTFLQINFQEKEAVLRCAEDVSKQFYCFVYQTEDKKNYKLYIPTEIDGKEILNWGEAHNMGIALCKKYNGDGFIILFEEEDWNTGEMVRWLCDYDDNGIRI